MSREKVGSEQLRGVSDAEQRLRRSEELHKRIAANLPDTGIFLLDRDLRITVAYRNRVGNLPWFDGGEFEGHSLDEVLAGVPPRVAEQGRRIIAAALEGDEDRFEFEGGGLSFSALAVPFPDPEEIEGVLVFVHDITERKHSAQALEANARRQRAAARLGQLALRERDLDTLFKTAAHTLAETLQTELSAVLERLEDGGEFRIRAGCGYDPSVGSVRVVPTSQAGYTLRTDGPVIVEDFAAEDRFEAAPILRAHGVASGVSVVVEGRDAPFGILSAHSTAPRSFSDEDVDFLTTVANVLSAAIERNRDEQASRHAALHDPLTGLPNRVLAIDRLTHALRRRERDGSHVAVLVMDLDRFKLINDSLGHDAGDALLLELAPRLRDAVRAEDTVARLGGDEFAVICPGLGSVRDAVRIAEKILTAAARPFSLEGSERYVTASVGIALATETRDRPESLMRDADVAMYRAKAAGAGRYEIFDDEMRARVIGRLRTESELRSAIDRDELRVVFQPIVDVETLQVEAIEALVRWQHPRLGLCGPDRFINVAEETGLIVDVGRWVLEESCRQAAELQHRLERRISLSVNVSPRQLTGPLFGAEVEAIARRSGMEPGTLALELTESALISETEAPQDTIRRLREHGLLLLLDDFGTGYSSLSHLKRFQLDGIKIDRAFVDGLGTDESDTAIVEAIIGMARALRLKVVAEGVETEGQLVRLRELGCQRAQGYLFARPIPAEELERHIAAPALAAAQSRLI
jgi:diguanylate cyclase (GGDEF)-like protein